MLGSLLPAIALFVAGCGQPSGVSSQRSKPQLLTQIEQVCLDRAEQQRWELRAQSLCDAACAAEWAALDAPICSCQRNRLDTDYSEKELADVVAITEIETSRRNLRDEGLATDSPLMLDLDAREAEIVTRIGIEKYLVLWKAFETTEKMCSDAISAEGIARAR